MARRQARKRSGQTASEPRRSSQAAGANWRYWLMVVVVALLAIVMIVTSLPLQ
jgi:uncharacterized protein involved in exopolysaccharide biosynthesis